MCHKLLQYPQGAESFLYISLTEAELLLRLNKEPDADQSECRKRCLFKQSR